MKQQKEYHREAHCQNCNMPLIGDYCANCGQKANFHKDSFGHMVAHFAGDYFHYDGKFWITVKTLFTQPGYITKNYIAGKRATYLHPIQLFIFVSTVFFLFFFNLNKKDKEVVSINTKNEKTNTNATLKQAINFGGWANQYNSLKEYDSLQMLLPTSKKDGWIKNKIVKQNLKILALDNFNEKFNEKTTHNLPKLFFVLMPFFALLLYALFRKNKLYYIDHLIFSIHFHSIVFILWSVDCLLQFISIQLVNFSQFALFFGFGLYLFLSLRTVYGNTFAKTLGKEFVILFLYGLGFLFFIIGLLLFSLLLL